MSKLGNPACRVPSRGALAGFTMIEIALSLGIVAFALVAIIGVLPSGMKVQRENREETIINQDGAYLLEAIRSGSRGVDDLTNYVESISVQHNSQKPIIYTNNVARPGGFVPLSNALHIVSLLSTPKLEALGNNRFQFNSVTARMKAISGGALDKGQGMADFAFRYQVTAEVVAVTNVPPVVGINLSREEVLRTANLLQNLYNVRLTLRWPLFQRGTGWDVGRYRRTVSTLVSGVLAPMNTNAPPNNLYLFAPDTFVSYH